MVLSQAPTALPWIAPDLFTSSFQLPNRVFATGVMMSDWRTRITINPNQCGGRPCIRGMRIRVIDVLDLLASGLTREKVLEEFPDLEAEDIEAVLRYASRRLDHPVLAA
jgi:uncharacterized protein (DUF433 family)